MHNYQYIFPNCFLYLSLCSPWYLLSIEIHILPKTPSLPLKSSIKQQPSSSNMHILLTHCLLPVDRALVLFLCKPKLHLTLLDLAIFHFSYRIGTSAHCPATKKIFTPREIFQRSVMWPHEGLQPFAVFMVGDASDADVSEHCEPARKLFPEPAGRARPHWSFLISNARRESFAEKLIGKPASTFSSINSTFPIIRFIEALQCFSSMFECLTTRFNCKHNSVPVHL